MADHPIDILLRARDQASKQIANVNKQLGLMGRASKGVNTALRNVGKGVAIGVGAGIGVGILAIKSGLDSLAEREDVISATAGAIKATGNAARVSAGDIRTWSEAIESATGAAVDDKAIQAGANALLRFKAVAGPTFKRALTDAVDLGAAMKTGPEAGAKLLGKALADPVKGFGALRKAGIVLTEADQKRIKQLVKANKLQQAQALILEKVEQRTKGAAAASQGPYSRALARMSDASEDAKMALAEGFLPVIERVADWIQNKLAQPGTITTLRNIGQNLADAVTAGLDFAEKIPWGTIADGLQKAAGFAKTLFDAFRSLPPEAQATIIALAGLNKLSGGAISGIVGEVGKGIGSLIGAGLKNIFAANVNVIGKSVTGPGLPGGPGGAPVPGAGSGGAGGPGGAKLGGTGGAAIFVPDMHQFNRDLADKLEAGGTQFGTDAAAAFRKQASKVTLWDQILAAAGIKELPGGKNRGTLGTDTRNPGEIIAAGNKKLDDIKTKQAEAAVTFRDGERNTTSAVQTGASYMASATRTAAAQIAGAVRAAQSTTNVYVTVGAGSVVKQQVKQQRAGKGTGSAGGGGRFPS